MKAYVMSLPALCNTTATFGFSLTNPQQ